MRFRRSQARAEPRIDITPLIDVIFQLLIFFLLTTRFITERSLVVELPVADASASSHEQRAVLVLDVDRHGLVHHEAESLDGPALDRLLRGRATPRTTLLLRADRAVDHGRVVDVMDRARAHGLTRIAIATRPPSASP